MNSSFFNFTLFSFLYMPHCYTSFPPSFALVFNLTRNSAQTIRVGSFAKLLPRSYSTGPTDKKQSVNLRSFFIPGQTIILSEPAVRSSEKRTPLLEFLEQQAEQYESQDSHTVNNSETQTPADLLLHQKKPNVEHLLAQLNEMRNKAKKEGE